MSLMVPYYQHLPYTNQQKQILILNPKVYSITKNKTYFETTTSNSQNVV